jgi:glycosyltransferase involved in cell wall biosynthesis
VFVIAKNTGGISEIVEHGKYGLLYNTKDELLRCLNWYCGNLKEVEKIKSTAYEMANERFSIKRYQQNVMEILLQ